MPQPLLRPPLPPPLPPPPLPLPPGTPALTSGTCVSTPKKLEEVESRRTRIAVTKDESEVVFEKSGGPASQGSCSCTVGSGAMIVTFLLRTAAPRSLAADEQRALAGAGALDAT